jgi:hypothetical protein
MVAAYTGLSRIGARSTTSWLADAFSMQGQQDISLSERLEIIRSGLTAHFQRPSGSSGRNMLGVVGAGYTYLPDRRDGVPRLVPIRWQLSNFLDDDGNPLPRVQEEFTLAATFLRQPGVSLSIAGQPLGVAECERLMRPLVYCSQRRLGPLPTARLLANAARELASENPRVGKALLVSSLPRSHVPNGWVIANAPPGPATASFWYLPSTGDRTIQYGPQVVDRQAVVRWISIARGGGSAPMPPPGWQP